MKEARRLYYGLDSVKLINSDINQRSVCLRQRVWGESIVKGLMRSFGNDRNVLYRVEVVVTLCMHLSIICQLYWKKVDLKIKIIK